MMAESGRVTDAHLRRIALARMINESSGGAVIAPWDVDQLDDGWLDAFRSLHEDMQQLTAARQKVTSAKNAWLARHPTYNRTH